MRAFIRESTSFPVGPSLSDSESRSEAEPGNPLTPADVNAIEALAWLTVGLGVLVIGLAIALTALAIFQ